jgi:gluconate 5-dehydrogenase
MKNYFDIKDKVALITGASSGLGWQIAQAYASQGAKLALFARREERLQENVAEIEKEYDRNTAIGTLKHIKGLGFNITKE